MVWPDCCQLDLENLHIKVTVEVNIEPNRTCSWSSSEKLQVHRSTPFSFLDSASTRKYNENIGYKWMDIA